MGPFITCFIVRLQFRAVAMVFRNRSLRRFFLSSAPLHVSSNGVNDLEFGIVSLLCLVYGRSFSQPASVSNESALNQQSAVV